MVDVKRQITEEEYKKALEEGPYSLIPENIIMGYGACGATVTEVNGEYYLSYSRFESCD